MATVSLSLSKGALRSEMKKKLAAMTIEERARQSSVVNSKVLQSSYYRNSEKVCVYLSMDHEEISTAEILKDIFTMSEKQCFVPRYTKEGMEMLKLNSLEDYNSLPVTKWNIKQPSANDNRIDALKSGGLDLILVPGLAFTSEGHRLGRGKGYYDVYLKKCIEKCSKPPVTIALAFKEQIVDSIPTAEYDVLINHVFHG